jgi:hypothetical protein
MTIMMAVLLAMQDTQVQDEAKTALEKAAAETIKGAVKIDGRVSRDSDGGQMDQMKILIKGLGQKEEPFEGKFGGVVSGEEAHLKIDTSDVVSDIYRRGDKVIKRQTWNKKRQGIEEFSNEAAALSNLTRFQSAIAKASKLEMKDGVVSGTLPTRLIGEAEEEEEDANNPLKMAGLGGKDTLQSIEFKATIADGKITKIVYTLVKESAMSNIIMRFGGGQNPFGGGDEDEDGQDKKKKRGAGETRVTYTLELSSTDAKVEIPKELDKFFTE